ncbi:MAG TPA: hypothetical protein VGC76_08945 [Pyrinomonadaceae bacterium]|jgi:hypothetical protein
MTKFLFILLLLLLVSGLVALRYRKQIQMALYMFRMFRKMRQMSKAPEEKQIEKTEASSDAKLVKCARCGTWIPQSKALNLRSKTFYCSANCMESAVVR